LCHVRRKRARSSKRGWKLEALPNDSDTFETLARTLIPPEETQSTLTLGKDVREAHPHTELILRHAWKIAYSDRSPVIKGYLVHKEIVRLQLQAVEAHRKEPVSTRLDSILSELDLDDSCNQRLLLHGTKPRHVEAILDVGMDEKRTMRGAFGYGVYLAEDPSKTNQYVEVDTAHSADAVVSGLHNALYRHNGVPHPGRVYYTFVCHAILGCPMYTKGPMRTPKSCIGPTPSCDPGRDVFVNRRRRELTPVPGSKPPCAHHSLIVLAGEDSHVKRHREFILFDGRSILPVFLLAYARQ